jgi:hypothetical protein
MKGDVTRPGSPIAAEITSGLGPKHLGWVLAWTEQQVQAQWQEHGQQYTRWIPTSAARRSHRQPKFPHALPDAAGSRQQEMPKALLGLPTSTRKTRNLSFKSRRSDVCAKCLCPIEIGQTARFNPVGLIVHDKHSSKEEALGTACPHCFLVGKCDCE